MEAVSFDPEENDESGTKVEMLSPSGEATPLLLAGDVRESCIRYDHDQTSCNFLANSCDARK